MGEFKNPFRPGAGHIPPYLAGREGETAEFRRLLEQETILANMILTGLRGVGKTVLLDTFKPVAIGEGWLWIGTDLSESSSISEKRLATRMITDLATVTSSIKIAEFDAPTMGFHEPKKGVVRLDFSVLGGIFDGTPGLVADKLKAVLETVWQSMKSLDCRGLIVAYDEAQNLSDHSGKDEYPLSLLLDVFQSIQKKGIPFMLALAGLPTLFPKLVEARTFAERMFHVVFLDQLERGPSREAIVKPIEVADCPLRLNDSSVDNIIDISGGYPYFIQFICREVYDIFIQQQDRRERTGVPVDDILRKLDSDFFSGRWARASDRQRDLLTVVAHLPNSGSEFSIQEVVEKSKEMAEQKKLVGKAFSPSHVNQMFVKLAEAGLLYKNRHGKYSFAIPLFGQFILRQTKWKKDERQRRLPFVDE